MNVRKVFPLEVKAATADGGSIVISTPVVDREHDRVLPMGARTESYNVNPIVQWGHNYHDPWATVGRTTRLEVNDDGIVVDFELRPPANDSDPQNIIRLLWQGGWVKTASIGFRPLQSQENEEGGRDYTEWELLEWSLVPVPANQQALRLAMKALEDCEQEQTPVRVIEVGDNEDLPAEKPYPNEHACRLRDPGQFQADSFRSVVREHEGKKYRVIMGRLRNETTMTEQAYRYPVDTWSAAEARSHCKSHDGSFEAARRGFDDDLPVQAGVAEAEDVPGALEQEAADSLPAEDTPPAGIDDSNELTPEQMARLAEAVSEFLTTIQEVL